MGEQQASGKLRSLAWPLFFTHTAREADRFAARLVLYNQQQVELDRREVVQFWGATMGEHSPFISHMLDPDEKHLIEQANRQAPQRRNAITSSDSSLVRGAPATFSMRPAYARGTGQVA